MFALALLAKASVCGLPLAAAAIDRGLLRKPWPIVLRRAAGWALIVLPILLAGRVAQPTDFLHPVPPGQRLLVAADAIGFYITKILVPYPLAIDYGRVPLSVSIGQSSTLLHLAAAIVVLGVAIWQRRRRGWIGVSVLVFIAGIGPVLGLVPFIFQLFSTVADRYAYPAMIGVAIAVAMGVQRLRTQQNVLLVAGGLAVVLGGMSFFQTGAWMSDEALLANEKNSNPSFIHAHLEHALEMVRQADHEADPVKRLQMLADAENRYRRAIALDPKNAAAHFDYANMMLRYADPAEAALHYEQANAYAHGEAPIDELRLQLNWGAALARLGAFDKALDHFVRATQIEPASAEAFANCGSALARLNRNDEARLAYKHALQLNPQQPQALAGLQRLSAPR